MGKQVRAPAKYQVGLKYKGPKCPYGRLKNPIGSRKCKRKRGPK